MDDMVYRQAAIDALARIAREKFNLSDEYNHYLAGLMDGELAIKNLPTIQPEPQWGRFERKRDGVFCSVCHNGWEFITGVPVEVEREYRYCPHCGAKMKGEPNE